MPTTSEKRAAFRKLHESGCFMLPNPWDVGSARLLEQLGFKALASTSSGAAWSMGVPDNSIRLEQAIAHLTSLVEATDLPLNADFEDGFAGAPEGVADNVRRCLAVGVAAVSIEDSTGDPQAPLLEVNRAVERMRAARAALDEVAPDALLVGRAECFLIGHADPLAESIRRLQAYASAGAHVLYAPGVKDRDAIATMVREVAPWPVNVLAMPASGLDLADLAALGVRRVSVGGALARAAWAGFFKAAREMADAGSFAALRDAASGDQLNGLFAARAGRHGRPA